MQQRKAASPISQSPSGSTARRKPRLYANVLFSIFFNEKYFEDLPVYIEQAEKIEENLTKNWEAAKTAKNAER